MNLGILGKKLGMTQVFDEEGKFIPVTVIEAGPCVVIQKKTVETDGYNALKVAYGNELKEKNLSNAHKGVFKKCGIPVKKYMKEFRMADHKDYQIGQEIKVDIFKSGDYVDVSGITKGKGFQGTVKRHNFSGGPKSHGQSDRLRAPGSIGSSSFPSRVFKGMKMSGHLGNVKKTVQKLEIMFIDTGKNMIMIKGAVPGPREGIVSIEQTVKKLKHVKPKQKVQVEEKVAKKAAKKAKAKK